WVIARPEVSSTAEPFTFPASARSAPLPVVVSAITPAFTGPVTVSDPALVREKRESLGALKDASLVIWFAAVRLVPPLEDPVRVPTVIAADCDKKSPFNARVEPALLPEIGVTIDMLPAALRVSCAAVFQEIGTAEGGDVKLF